MQRPIVIAVAIVVVLGAALFLWWGRDAPPEVPAPAPEPAAPVQEEPQEEADLDADLPPLEASDDLVRQLARRLTDDPALAAAVVPDGLLRRFVAATHAVSRGRSPRRPLSHMEPEESFRVAGEGEELVMSPESTGRYEPWADLIVSLDAASTVEVYRRLEPLVDRAYRELGDPRAEFDDTLLRAIDHLLAAPVPEERIRIEDTGYEYLFADPELEEASPAQKHLLRMGAARARAVQAKLREIRAELGG